jgi:hypothetical protein
MSANPEVGERSRLGALADWIDARFPMTRL